jgi:hypothetical protein
LRGKETPIRDRSRAFAASVLALLTIGAVAGCTGTAHGPASGGSHASGGATAPSSNPAPPAGAPASRCGTGHTAAGVPVEIEIQHGTAAQCRQAMTIEHAYTRALASGKVAGNGGGAPVTIHGWVCQGYNTPEVLQTGQTSACRKKGSEILAVLPTPSPSPTSS